MAIETHSAGRGTVGGTTPGWRRYCRREVEDRSPSREVADRRRWPLTAARLTATVSWTS